MRWLCPQSRLRLEGVLAIPWGLRGPEERGGAGEAGGAPQQPGPTDGQVLLCVYLLYVDDKKKEEEKC